MTSSPSIVRVSCRGVAWRLCRRLERERQRDGKTGPGAVNRFCLYHVEVILILLILIQ